MSNEVWKETFVEQKVTYVLEQQGKVLIIENVPATSVQRNGRTVVCPRNGGTLATNCLGAKNANSYG